MKRIKYNELTRDEQARDLSWVVGPVLSAIEAQGSSLVLVSQGFGAYAVVNMAKREYIACCGTNAAAKRLIAKMLTPATDPV